MQHYFKTEKLSIGYNGKILVGNIDIALEKGKILTLIGPNGSGKSTLLKTIAAQLSAVSGAVYIDSRKIADFPPKELAKEMALVTTERIRPELLSCAEVAAMGRYPHTGIFGGLNREDERQVKRALSMVDAENLADKCFLSCSDGQRQRIMIARALCQQPRVLILDEPTAYLDIRHKIELLCLLRQLAEKEHLTVIMSLHEIDLAVKASDFLLCVKENGVELIYAEKTLEKGVIERLYDLDEECYSPLLGSFELKKPKGEPQVFVIAGGGCATGCYRQLQRKNIPFATGILFENDVDLVAARLLSEKVITVPAFEPMKNEHFDSAAEILQNCKAAICLKTPFGSFNELNRKLLELAEQKDIPIYCGE